MEAEELIEALERGERERRPVESDGIRFTHLDRMVWPESGQTKGDLVRYYVRVAPVMLRYVQDRPLMLKRYPRGIEGKGVVQQRVATPVPDGVRTGDAPTAAGEQARRYIGARTTLLYAAELDVIEIHCWHSRVSRPDRPDWVIFDLDPNQGAGMDMIVQIARALRHRLGALELPSVVKTSGSRGLHIHVPTGGRIDYAEAAEFARRVARHVAGEAPSLATVERTVAERGRRIYIDHLQNARGKTAVAPYSARARRGAPVALPIRWEEVDEGLNPRGFGIVDVPARLERAGDVWAGALQRPGVAREHFLA